MKFRDHEISIIIDDSALPEYDVQTDDALGCITCWIPSEVGKEFSITWTCLKALPYDTIFYSYIDGAGTGAISRQAGSMTVGSKKGKRISESKIRPFQFSRLETTDDEVYLDDPEAKNIGDIRVEIWQAILSKRKRAEYSSRPIQEEEEVKVHGRTKKALTHRVSYGEPVGFKKQRKSLESDITPVRKVAEYLFRYRSLDFLRAQGIAPLAPPSPSVQAACRKRKAAASPEPEQEVEEEESDHEHEMVKARLEILRAEFEFLASQIAKKDKKRVKIEPKPPKLSGSSEIIDLT